MISGNNRDIQWSQYCNTSPPAFNTICHPGNVFIHVHIVIIICINIFPSFSVIRFFCKIAKLVTG